MAERKKELTTQKKRVLVAWGCILIAVFVGATLWLFWPREAQVDTGTVSPTCPPRPTHKTGFAIRNYYAGTGRITFDATKDMATATEEFGKLYPDPDGGYTLWMNGRYDFAEVLAYLESWPECHDGADAFLLDRQGNLTLIPEPHPDIHNVGEFEYPVIDSLVVQETPTPTPTPDSTLHLDSDTEYTVVGGGRCYVEVPECIHDSGEGFQWTGPCPVEWGREVSCGDEEQEQ